MYVCMCANGQSSQRATERERNNMPTKNDKKEGRETEKPDLRIGRF